MPRKIALTPGDLDADGHRGGMTGLGVMPAGPHVDRRTASEGSVADPEAVTSGQRNEDDEVGTEGEDRRGRRWYGLLVVILLLLLLLCCAVTSVDLIVTKGPQQARFIARNLTCLQCHTEMIPLYAKSSVHNPFLQRECTVCHTPHGRQVTSIVTQSPGKTIRRYETIVRWLPLRWWFGILEGFGLGGGSSVTASSSGGTVVSKATKETAAGASHLVSPPDQLCWTCHGDMGLLLGDQYQHLPFSKGQCLGCHDPHASDFRALLSQAPDKLCFTCHPIGEQINRAMAHPPAKNGQCTSCHSPHASQFKGILVASQRDVCFGCHPSVASLVSMPVQHEPFVNDDCTGCHEPHGSDFSPLLDSPQPTLCYRCHPAIQNQFAQASHHPIGVELRCSSCHDPHAAQYKGLITARNNDFCFECHGEKKATYDDSLHKNRLCIQCHTPHGSQYSPMLTKANPDLCLSCHPDFEGQGKHPVRPAFFDIHAKEGLTCTSSCHNPHGSSYQYMIRNFNWSQDGMCLQCHLYVGIRF